MVVFPTIVIFFLLAFSPQWNEANPPIEEVPRPRRCKAGGLGGAWECNQSPTNEEMWHYDGNGCLKTPTWDEDCDGNPVEISGFATKRACMEICALCDIYGHSCD